MQDRKIVRVNVEVIYEDGTVSEYKVARAKGGELAIVDYAALGDEFEQLTLRRVSEWPQRKN